MVRERLDPETEDVWREFHGTVNMRGEELRRWLLTDASGPDHFAADPSMDVSPLGRRVVEILDKRQVDLTGADVDTMRDVVERARRLLAAPEEERGEQWRHALMTLGHDPLRPDPSSPEEEPTAEGPQ
ncbi:DUF3140 domain-containing protein [Streptomonospora litoralis]|uniref:DUF3140 domain-containing protein n=1 Tax=Streptomonospora litoralis TaxID=2498135 RepID=A0A4P6Q596_9ACTN|nr:DUF3140 domain-containing protein [Streptomonospora litoralis]QBI54521.1 hypothetical protein EKD16_13695 [Streptomonospora litoralis]